MDPESRVPFGLSQKGPSASLLVEVRVTAASLRLASESFWLNAAHV